jgi:antitoxin PrlF
MLPPTLPRQRAKRHGFVRASGNCILLVRRILLTFLAKPEGARMATTLTVTAKGQVTLRKEVLRHLGVTAGQKVEVDLLPNGHIELRAAKSPTSIENFFGCLQRPDTKPLTIEEIGEIAAQGWAGCR